MTNGIFKISWVSLADACVTAVVVAVLAAAVTMVGTAGFSVWTANWALVGQNMTNLAFVSFVLTLGKAFLSTNSGSLLGVGPATNTPAQSK